MDQRHLSAYSQRGEQNNPSESDLVRYAFEEMCTVTEEYNTKVFQNYEDTQPLPWVAQEKRIKNQNKQKPPTPKKHPSK